MSNARKIIGLAAIAMGLLWLGQGLGLVRWPQTSFMIDQRSWVLWGALLVAIGVAVLVAKRRR